MLMVLFYPSYPPPSPSSRTPPPAPLPPPVTPHPSPLTPRRSMDARSSRRHARSTAGRCCRLGGMVPCGNPLNLSVLVWCHAMSREGYQLGVPSILGTAWCAVDIKNLERVMGLVVVGGKENVSILWVFIVAQHRAWWFMQDLQGYLPPQGPKHNPTVGS